MMETFSELAAVGRAHWKMMMDCIKKKDGKGAMYHNEQWNIVNNRIRDKKYAQSRV